VTGIVEELVTIPDRSGGLEGVLAYPAEGWPVGGLVVAGPHPFLGGQLENNVVQALAGAGTEEGWLTLRFAYRAPDNDLTGQMDRFWATGHAPQDGELVHDLRAAVTFAGTIAPVTCLASYSFGCWLVSRLVAEDRFSGAAVMVTPTVGHHDFSTMRQWDGPKLVVGSADDFATPAEQLTREVETWQQPVSLKMFEAAEHFFRGREGELTAVVSQWLAGLPEQDRHPGDGEG
jgi:alpha/beta superfamily hydrolase